MDSNANQRKRTGRLAKMDMTEGMGPPPPQIIDNNEVLEVTALAISPTLEEGESTHNIPAAECRRSSRKKIIKFDVRDLLNKNRKPHKIQIEARIDSNAPTTSKSATATSGELTSAKPLTISGDLLTKQKTFLEKSAIFRRYSISQEPKPPPPPLPLPPSLLAKAGDNKDNTGPGSATSRRLSRTQEFFSNVMIKPKQTASLIVAQMESSAPSQAGKRKSLNKFVEIEAKNTESIDNTTVQKRRGRPSKTKIKSTEETSLATSTKEDLKPKKLTPEKATNWKEYKACLAQQTGSGNKELTPQEKIEESLLEDVLIEISSTSSHNSNIDEPLDNKSLIDEQHQGIKIQDDPPVELNLIPEITKDDKNSPRSIINPYKTQDDLNQANKNKNKIKKLETTAPEQVQENVVHLKPKDSEESSRIDDDNIEKEAKKSQLNINEDLKTTNEGKGEETSANRDESLQEPAIQFSNEMSTGNKGQTVPEITIHKETSSETNKEDNNIYNQGLMDSKGITSPTIANDSSDIVNQIAQWTAEQATEFGKTATSNDSLQKEKVEQNIDHTTDAKHADNLPSDVDTKVLQSSKEVTFTRESRSKRNKSPQEQDVLLKEKKSKNPETSNRRSRSKHNNSPQEKADSQPKDEKTKFNSPLAKEIKLKISKATEDECMDDKTKFGSPLTKETKHKIIKATEDEIITIKDQPELEVSLQKDEDKITEQPGFAKKSIKDDSIRTDSKFDDGQSALKTTRSASKLKVPQEKTDSQTMDDKTKFSSPLPKETKISKATEDETITIKDQPELEVSLQKDEDKITDQSGSEKKSIKDDSIRIESNFDDGPSAKEALKNTRSASKMKDPSPEKVADNILQSKKETEVAASTKKTKNVFSTQKKEEITKASTFEDVKDKEDLLPTTEQTKLTEKSTETSIKKVTETTPTNTRKSNKKTINEQKEDDTEAANESHVENRLEEAIETAADGKDKTTIKRTPRNKRNLNKQDESLKHAENKNDSSTSKKSNEDQPKEQTNIEEKTTSDSNIIHSLEELPTLKRTELKTPDPSSNTTQDQQENTPNIKIPINENPEPLLSQPSTPLEKKSLNFSRTSSSSESENQSERSSYSSATTSSTSTSSTSTRSYKSGDKLKVSLKRMSLPQSPSSSSSQISTPEKQCSPSSALSEDIKKKLPKAKRSKRLQKKFVEMLDNQNSAENIDDCFQKITTSNKDELQISNTTDDIVETDLQSINKAEQIKDNEATESSVKESPKVSSETMNILEKSNEKDSNADKADDNPLSIELDHKQMKCVPTEEFLETATQLQIATDLIDPIKPTTSKVKPMNDNSAIIKRKSLRNRKDNDSTEKDPETIESPEEADRKKQEKDQDEKHDQETKEIVSIEAETVEERDIIKRKSLRNRKDNDSTEKDPVTKESQEETGSKIEKKEIDHDEKIQETKENVSIIAETVVERDIQQQQEQQIEIETTQESVHLETEEQQEKLNESKQKQRNRKLKDPRLSLTKPKQQQKRKPKDEQTEQQENEKDVEKLLEQPLKENQPDTIKLKKQEDLITETSCLKVVEKEEVTIEIPHKSKDVNKEEKLHVATESLEDKDKFKAVENLQSKEIKEKESATEKSKEIDIICELKTKESSSKTRKTDELKAEVNEKNYSKNTPTKDESSITNISGKSARSCIDSKETETSKITRSKTAKDKTISNAESSKVATKSSDELSKADIPTLQKEISKICSQEEKPKEEEIDSTKKEEASSSSKAKETSLVIHKEPNDELLIEESFTTITDSSSKPDEPTIKNEAEVTERKSPTTLVSLKTKPDIERPTSAKRKSLRNQKEFNTTVSSIETNEENSLEKPSAELTKPRHDIVEEPIFTVNTLEVKENKLDILQNVNVPEAIKVPKKRGRKSRFKNLHSPEPESETSESSTGKQTPIEETILAEKKDDYAALTTTENVDKKTNKELELVDKELTPIIKELSEDKETLTTVDSSKENEDVIKLPNEEKSPLEPDFVKESVLDPDNSLKPLTTKTDPTESYIIQNVSIATNTLLDILRTVQSNTAAAALEANNKKTENPLEEISTKDENTSTENKQTTLISEDLPSTSQDSRNSMALKSLRKLEKDSNTNSPTENKQTTLISEDLPSTSQDRTAMALKSLKKLDNDSNTNSPTRCDTASPLTLKSLRKLDTDSNTNSPNRCDSNSPLTLKKVNISPTRSDSNSPLTLKKVGQSPTRSDTSSPLTLKKVTRRYERRSRRGEDSDHKTLEETFAEIAAQSSKAVLAAKSFDSNDEFPVGEVKEKDDEPKAEQEVKVVAEATSTENPEKLEDTSLNMAEAKVLEKVSPEIQEKVVEIQEKVVEIQEHVVDIQENLEISKNISNTEKSEDLEKLSDVIETSESIIPETVIETAITPIAEKVTPARRGRKPKNRSMDIVLPLPKDSEIKNSPKTKKGLEKSTVTGLKDKDIAKDLDEASSVTENPLKTLEENLQKPESTLVTPTKLEDNIKPANDEQDIRELNQTPELTSKSQDDSKSSKKSNKKSDASKESITTTIETEDEVRTPKQPVKKRDSSLTKSETKSGTKKSSKKSKNNEEDQDTIPKTTTPPPKRGRKPKNQQEAIVPTSSSSKKKNKKEASHENDDNADNVEEKRKDLESESESVNTSLDKSLDEKMAKKKRQKKLKEAFEAALTEDLNKSADLLSNNSSSLCSTSSSTFGLTLLNKSPPPECSDSFETATMREACLTPVDEDPDPLKDIEKFIADGVNLLKKDYKLDEDSVGDVIATTIKTNENEDLSIKSTIEEDKAVYNTFETPADTPVTTPSITPPPKSPLSLELSTTPDENSGVRRSHRIKLITQTPKALVGRGLVRDKERFSIKDDVETKSHYTLDDHLLDLAEVEAKNAKFLKEMEERLSNFQVIKENEYLCERVISREARKMICDCFLTHEEEERGELGCGEDCLNRLLMIECGPECNVKERCTNKRFQKLLCSPCRVFRTEKKGFGIMADIEILPGEFIMEYVGDVIDTEIFEQRRIMYSQDKNRHYYFMALRSDAIIDATIQGNISRFINHSCDPNAETQKWTVNGELRIGFFSRKSIMPGEEITFNYQYQRYGREAQRCYCESSNCRGWIGQEPTSDEGEQIDDDDDDYEESEDDEEEELEQDTSQLLVHDDDEDSDASVTDPEEVQKKLEMAAAQAEVELAPIQISEDKEIDKDSLLTENKDNDDSVKPEAAEEEEDSKSKFKKLLTKMAEKVAAKQKQNKRQQKLQRKKKSKESSADLTNKLRFSEDPDIEDEVEFLRECGLKNQSDTLRLSRLMVRAKLVQTRLNLLDILQKGDLPCRRLFLDYHGLRLVHGWMSEDAGNMQIRLALLQTLETLPIANKTVLTDSKVMQMVRNWCGPHTTLSPNEDSSSSNSNSQDNSLQPQTNIEEAADLQELHKLALKLITTWEGLPEIFRIPKKERIEQMKEHEREADRQYAANAETEEENKTSTDRYRRNRFGTTSTFPTTTPSNRFTKPNNGNPLRTLNTKHEGATNLSKAQRREMFAAKVARDEAEKRMAEERREFETKCRFFGLDPKKTRPQDVPFCVNPATGQWYSVERKPIITPPSYTHVQVPVKPKSTDPNDYQLPAACSTLTAQWKYAITPQGKIYYYHIKYRIPQWEPPTAAQMQLTEMEADDDDSEGELTTTAGEDSSEDDDDILIGMDAVQLRAYMYRKVETRRQKRYQRLVDQRAISPRREEDRVYNQIEVRKYKENKEKIRKRKEEIRRKRAEALRQSSLNMCTLGSLTDNTGLKLQTESDEELGALPIQDYLLSSDEDGGGDLKTDVNNSALLDKIVEGDKIVDELDALTSKRQLKRPLPPHRDLNEQPTTSAVAAAAVLTSAEKQEYKKRKLEKKDKKKPKDQDAKYRKNKEKFRCEIAGIIVHYLKPYRRETCPKGHIQTNEDFNHLARKLTHFVMIKELKYCESVGQTLVVTESVKNKSREFIKKYMAKYGEAYVKPTNDPEFKDIPFTL